MTSRLLQLRLSDPAGTSIIPDVGQTTISGVPQYTGVNQLTLTIPDSHKLAKNSTVYLKSYSVLFNSSSQANSYVALDIPWLFPGLTSANLITGVSAHNLILPMTPATRSEHQMSVNWPLYVHEVPSKTTVRVTRPDTSINGPLTSINLVLEAREVEN